MKTIIYKGYTIREDGIVLGKYGKEIGVTNSKGYTYVNIDGKQMLRHRLIWKVFNGEIPTGLEIDHKIPLSQGGTDELSNLRLSTHHENCNNENSKNTYKVSNKKKGIVKKNYIRIGRFLTEEEKKEYKHQWLLKNKEKLKEYKHQWYLKNKERIKEHREKHKPTSNLQCYR